MVQFWDRVENVSTKLIDVTPIEAINEANFKTEVTLDYSKSFGISFQLINLNFDGQSK